MSERIQEGLINWTGENKTMLPPENEERFKLFYQADELDVFYEKYSLIKFNDYTMIRIKEIHYYDNNKNEDNISVKILYNINCYCDENKYDKTDYYEEYSGSSSF